MKIYVAAPLAVTDLVQCAQERLLSAGHSLSLDWTRDMTLVEHFATQPQKSAVMASTMINAVLAADAVVVLATEHDGRGMFVELGAALASAEVGRLRSIAVVGDIAHESVFYFHPRITRYPDLDHWIAALPQM